MRLSHLTVSNYRGLRELSVPLSRFGCLIGRNNAGKSTVLQAVALFFSGTRLTKNDFFDESNPIRIAISFCGISQDDLGRLASEHREKIEKVVTEGNLTLVRYYGTDGKSRLRVVSLLPKDCRFQDEAVATLLKGKRKSNDVISAVEAEFPELIGKLDSSANQTKAREAIQHLADTLPVESKDITDADLPTGIDSSIANFLPECIYIPAVKNLSDDIKTSQTTTFGKILGILLEAVEPKLGDVAKLFQDLHSKFNLVESSDGRVTDNRLDEVRQIENTVQSLVRESFSDVSLEIKIPPPELRTILSSAQIMVDDGVYGSIDSKGDGLRRAVVFAVLRAYVQLSQPGGISSAAVTHRPGSHVLLFEEPEIYLHPSAQHTLFDALRVFSERNHVLISTHSPTFFGPSTTDNFIRLTKCHDPSIAEKPFTVACRVDMDDMKEKDRFQLICFENNNAAFFFDTVVLVEGDSDFIVFPHIARLVNPKWESAQAGIRFARIGGKGSIRRYRQFFARFGVTVVVITDLDILTKDFDQVEPDPQLTERHSRLIQLVDQVLGDTGKPEPASRSIQDAHASGDLRSLWRRVRNVRQRIADGNATHEDLEQAVENFFSWEKRHLRLEVIRESKDATILATKRDILARLRKQGIIVLEKGSLESYYPDSIEGHDKPTKAQDFCRKVTTRDAVLALCNEMEHESGSRKEFELLCDCLCG